MDILPFKIVFQSLGKHFSIVLSSAIRLYLFLSLCKIIFSEIFPSLSMTLFT